jgi:tetratricopeptide (TPR) repeat protein
VLVLARPAFADTAKEHVDKATAAHAAGRYADALAELESAYKLDPQPGLLYAIGQVLVKLDRCSDAVGYYERYLATNPEAKPSAAAKEAIASCKDKLASAPPPPPIEPPKPEPKPEPKPVVAELPGPERPEPPASAKRPFYSDVIGDALVVAGVAAGVFGIVEYRGASSDIDSARTAPTYGDSEKLVAHAGDKRTVALIAGGAGAALAIAGVVHYVIAGGKSERRVTLAPTHGGAALAIGGRF